MNSFLLVSVLLSTLGKFASAVIVRSGTGEPGQAITQANTSMDAFMEGRMNGKPLAPPPSIPKGLLIVTAVAAHDGYVQQNMSILLDAKVDGKYVVAIPDTPHGVIPGVMVSEPYNTSLQYVDYKFDSANLEPKVQEALQHGKDAITAFWDMHKKDKPEYEGLGDLEFAYRPYWIFYEGTSYKFVKVIAAADKP